MHRCWQYSVRALAVCLALGAGYAAVAYPGSVNLIPCCDFVGPGSVRIAYESDGIKQPFGKDYMEYLYTQFGIGERFECGVDFCDFGGITDKQYNAKYLLSVDNGRMPSVALGAMNVGKLTKSSFYLVGCKDLSALRLHLGCQTSGGDTWVLIGADRAISKSLTLLADFQSGPGRCHTLGLYWQATPSIAATVYCARNNTPEFRDDSDFVGLNVAYTFQMR